MSPVPGLARPPRPSVLASTGLNLAGTGLPLAAALVGLPLIASAFGAERLGFLTLAWAVVGYLSLFDLGIGRALTKAVAERAVAERAGADGAGTADGPREGAGAGGPGAWAGPTGAGGGPGAPGHPADAAPLHRLVATGLALMAALGLAAGLGLYAGAGWLARDALAIRPELRDEAVRALEVLALGVPFAVVTAGLRGVLEAQGRFLASNAVRAPLGAWLFLSPLLLVPFGVVDLAWMMALLVAGRVAGTLGYAVACARGLPGLARGAGLGRADASALLRAGGWMTVSNVVGPLLVYVDRFVVGNRLSLEAVAWYATPYEVVTKVLVVPSAAAGVLFPLFAATWGARPAEAAALHRTGARYLALAVFPPTFLMALFAPEALALWLGPEFAARSAPVVAWLAVGCLANAVAHVPLALVQGSGRPDLAARIHLVELPLHLALLFALVAAFGVTGAAAAFAIRATVDLVLLERAARGRVPAARGGAPAPGAGAGLAAAAGVAALFAVPLALDLPLPARAALAAAVLAAEAALVWNVLLERDGLGSLKTRVRAALRLPVP